MLDIGRSATDVALLFFDIHQSGLRLGANSIKFSRITIL